MPKVYDFKNPNTITIKNVIDPTAPGIINAQALTGKRRVMTLAEAQAAGFTVYDYLLDNKGNFVIDDSAKSAQSIDPNSVMVVVTQSTKITDRLIQLYRTQQQILLAAGDELSLTARTANEAAHYLSLAIPGEIEVTAESVKNESETHSL